MCVIKVEQQEYDEIMSLKKGEHDLRFNLLMILGKQRFERAERQFKEGKEIKLKVVLK
jgi:hypothetical protein